MLELAAALKHDLGKYVAWQSANFDDPAWTGPLGAELAAALRHDLLRTRTSAAGDSTAWEVWAFHTEGLARPLSEPELRRVEAAVGVLHSFEGVLRSETSDALARARPAIRQAQLEIRSALAALYRRLRRG